MRDAAGAIAWMKDQDAKNSTGWKGYCLKACRTAWDLPGGTADADQWWADCPDEYKHPWDDAPPLGMPIYWEIGAHGHICLSDGTGKMYGTDIPVVDQIGHADTGAPQSQWGAKPVGWANWLNGAVLPLDTTTPPTNGSDRMLARLTAFRNADFTVEPGWDSQPVFDEVVRQDGNWKVGANRYLTMPAEGWLAGGWNVETKAPANLTLAVERITSDGEVIEVLSKTTANDTRSTVAVAGAVAKGSLVRFRIYVGSGPSVTITQIRLNLGITQNP